MPTGLRPHHFHVGVMYLFVESFDSLLLLIGEGIGSYLWNCGLLMGEERGERGCSFFVTSLDSIFVMTIVFYARSL